MNQDVNTVLKQFGYDLALQSNDSLLSGFTPLKTKTTGNARSFSKEKMRELHSEAIVKVQYAKNFWVMRFLDGHFIKQKYAPFSLNEDGTWSMKRPEGLLPIYHTNVMMCIANNYSIICLDSIDSEIDKQIVLKSLKDDNKEIIEIKKRNSIEFLFLFY